MTESPLRGFDRSLPMALLRSRESLMRQFRPMLADHGLTEQQWRVIRALAGSELPMDVGEIADATFLLGPSLSRILSNLNERSLIIRQVDKDDQRRFSVTLSRSGHRLFERIAPMSEQIYGEIEERFGVGRLDELLTLLNELEKS
ncbi:MAG: homoprotocatechuate degradation operon regulator HpaR [Acidimicrobiales bacterium]